MSDNQHQSNDPFPVITKRDGLKLGLVLGLGALGLTQAVESCRHSRRI